MNEYNMSLLDTLIERAQREDKKQGYRNLEEACNYLESEGYEINAGTVSRNLKNKSQKPSNATSIRNDPEGYMRYINARREAQVSKRSHPQLNKTKENIIYNIDHWMKIPHDQVCLTLITTLVNENSLKNQLNAQKNLNRALEFDPDRFIGVENHDDEIQVKKITQDLLDDIKEVINILSNFANYTVDRPIVIVTDKENMRKIGLFNSKEFLHASESR